jgi:hypothetical protein
VEKSAGGVAHRDTTDLGGVAGRRCYHPSMSSGSTSRTIFGVALWVGIALVLMGRGSCADPQSAVTALKNQGFSHVIIIDQSYMFVGVRGCDGSDAARFTAQATNPVGKRVKLYVCVGWPFKGATIRTP